MSVSPLSRIAGALAVVLILTVAGTAVLQTAASGAAGPGTARHLRALTQAAAAQTAPARGRRAALHQRARFAPRWRRVSSASRVRRDSITVTVRHRSNCVYWPHNRATVAAGSCGSARRALGVLTGGAARQGTASQGHASAVRLLSTLSPAQRRHSSVSGISAQQFTVTVAPYHSCVSWGADSTRVTQRRCPESAAGTTGTAIPGNDTRFGFYPGTDSPGAWKGSTRERFDEISSSLGSPGVYRVYFDGLPPTSFRGSKADFGIPVVLSFKANPARVAAGDYDAQLRSFFDSIPTGRMVWWSFYHEPEDNIAAGEFTAAQYRAAWKHLLAIAPSRSTLRSTLILMRWDLESRVLNVSDYVVPGVDVLAWDAYVRTWSPTVADAYDKAARVSASYGMGFGIAETSVDNHMADPPSRASVVRDVVQHASADHAQFVTWFETNKSDGDWRLGPYTKAADLWNELT